MANSTSLRFTKPFKTLPVYRQNETYSWQKFLSPAYIFRSSRILGCLLQPSRHPTATLQASKVSSSASLPYPLKCSKHFQRSARSRESACRSVISAVKCSLGCNWCSSQCMDNLSSCAYSQSIFSLSFNNSSRQLPHPREVVSLPTAPCVGQGQADRTGKRHKVK